MRRFRLQLSAASTAATLFLSGCGPCGASRYVGTRGDMTGAQVAPAVGTAHTGRIDDLSLGDDERLDDTIHWLMFTSLPAGSVTAVHIHEGRPGQTGRILYTLPARFFEGGGGSFFNIGALLTYDGPVSIDTLYDLLARGQAYVDIHTVGHPDGELRAQLELVDAQDWSDYYCD
jgi:hypothetical protein